MVSRRSNGAATTTPSSRSCVAARSLIPNGSQDRSRIHLLPGALDAEADCGGAARCGRPSDAGQRAGGMLVLAVVRRLPGLQLQLRVCDFRAVPRRRDPGARALPREPARPAAPGTELATTSTLTR